MLVEMGTRNRIMHWLGQRGMTIQEMSRLADMSYSTAHNIATSEEIPEGVRWGTMRKIAKVLKVSVSELEVEEDKG